MTNLEIVVAVVVGILASATAGVFLMAVIAWVVGKLKGIPMLEVFDSQQVWVDEVMQASPHYNRLTESALPLVKGDRTDFEEIAFALDTEPTWPTRTNSPENAA